MSEGADRPVNRTSVTGAFLNSVNSPTFPIMELKFLPAVDKTDSVIEVRLPKEIVDLIKSTQMADEFPLVLPASGQIALWSFDITLATKILSSMGILSSKETWTLNSQAAIISILNNKKIDSKRLNDDGLNVAKAILEDLGLIEAVKENAMIFLAVTDLTERGQMDPDTIIYKIALGIYHSNRLTGQSFFPDVDDESAMYLKFIQVGLEKKFEAFKIMEDLPLDARSKTLKITVCLLIAAYTYYRVVGGQ